MPTPGEGIRIEELGELSHHSLIHYKLPAAGELVPLLRVWNPPMPLLFQRHFGGEHRPIAGPAVRELISNALTAAGSPTPAANRCRSLPTISAES